MPPHHQFELPCGIVDVLFERGARPTVLLIHGNSACKDVFASQIAALRAHGFGYLALDLPGHGRSQNARDPQSTYSFVGYADAVEEILTALHLDRVHVAGWSLGGHVGLELMGRDQRVASLFLWGTPPVAPGAAALQAFRTSDAMNYAGLAQLDERDCEAYAHAMSGMETAPELLLAAIRRTDGAARTWMVGNSLNGVGLDARALVSVDPRPLAVVHGADDPFVKREYLEGLRCRNLWRGKIQIMPGVGHAAHLQSPEEFNAMLLSFLHTVS